MEPTTLGVIIGGAVILALAIAGMSYKVCPPPTG